ncbi:hypothetical protein [Archangium sp.]|uniref:hypothetical protein n=1 Tax=Archangium sp. TaxID=1872627 RepID=UPI00286A2F5C|nr:hypothetical protein [Archangium sp.]
MEQPAETRSTGQTILLVVAGTLLLLLLLLAGAYWRLTRRSHEAVDALVAEAQELAQRRWPRPSHMDTPTPGTFAQAIGPLMPELLRLHKAEPKLDEPLSTKCREVRDGKRPLAELPGECREALERGRSLMQRALLTSRTEEAGPPEGLQTLSDPKHPSADSGLIALQHIHKLAALDIRFQLEAGQTEAALETCLDGLALARDVGHGTGLVGAMVSAAGHGQLFHPCAEALRRASPTGQKKATAALRRIREGLNPFELAMREESIAGPLMAFGRLFDHDQLAALPAGAKATALQGTPELDVQIPVFGTPLMRHALLAFRRFEQQQVTVVELPPSARGARLQALHKSMEDSWNPIVKLAIPDFGKFAARVDQQRARLDLLLALALVKQHRAESGAWPTSLPPLYPERPVLLPTALKLQPDEAGTLRVVPEKAHLEHLKAVLDPETARLDELLVTATP